MSFEYQLNKSTSAFMEHLSPIIIDRFGGGEIYPIEGTATKEIADKIDALSGIDHWYFKADEGVFGLASRVQFTDYNWRTFTIRKSKASGYATEFLKRCHQIDNGYLYPTYTCQGYIKDDKIIGFAIARTVDIIDFIKTHQDKVWEQKNPEDGTVFYCVSWGRIPGENGWYLVDRNSKFGLTDVNDKIYEYKSFAPDGVGTTRKSVPTTSGGLSRVADIKKDAWQGDGEAVRPKTQTPERTYAFSAMSA